MHPSPQDAAILVLPTEPLTPEALEGAVGGQEKLERARAWLEPLDRRLRAALAAHDVAVERLDGIGGWTIRGAAATLPALRAPDGPLAGLPVVVADDATFFPTPALTRPP